MNKTSFDLYTFLFIVLAEQQHQPYSSLNFNQFLQTKKLKAGKVFFLNKEAVKNGFEVMLY